MKSSKIYNPEKDSSFSAYCHNAEEVALRLIARAEQNTIGLTAKLERKGFDTSVIKEVIFGLVERGLLDDERYAALWLRSRLAKQTKTPKWLLFSLRKRGIDRISSQKAIEKVLDPDTEYALLLEYIENTEPSKSKNKLPLRTQLKHEGFSLETLDRYFSDF